MIIINENTKRELRRNLPKRHLPRNVVPNRPVLITK